MYVGHVAMLPLCLYDKSCHKHHEEKYNNDIVVIVLLKTTSLSTKDTKNTIL
jgi:hypothetical protein